MRPSYILPPVSRPLLIIIPNKERMNDLAVLWLSLVFGTAFELGCHAWFAFRRLITNSRISAFTGDFLKSFFKETSQEDRKTKNWAKGDYCDMENCGSGTANRLTNSKWPNDGWNNKRHNNSLTWPANVLSLFFPCRNFCAENFVIFFYKAWLLLTDLLTYLNTSPTSFGN